MGLSRFLAPRVVDSWQAVLQAFRDVQSALDRATRSDYVQGLAVQDLQLACPGFYRVAPPLLGIRATLPRASEDNAGARVCLSIEGALGSITVFAPPGQTIAGSSTATFSANGLIELYSNGVNAWVLVNQLAVEAPLPATVLPGLSVLGRAPNSSGVQAAITATAASQYSRVNAAGTSLEWGNPASTSIINTAGTFVTAAVSGDITIAQNGTVAAFRTMGANTLLANATNATAVPADLASNAQGVIGRTSGNLQSIDSSVQTALIRGSGSVFWATAAASQALRRNATGDLGFGSLDLTALTAIASDTFVGNVSGSTAAPIAVSLSSLAGTSLVFTAHTFVTAAVTGDVTRAQNSTVATFRSFGAKSVLANATNALAVPSDLAGSAAFQHLRVNATNTGLEWSLLTSGDFPFGVIPLTGLATQATDTFLGNIAGITTTPTAINLAILAGAGLVFGTHTLDVTAGAGGSIVVGANDVQRAALTGAITASQDSNATAFGVLAAKSVLANATNASAVPAALAGSAAFQHLRVNAANTALEWSVLTTGDFPAGSVPISALAAFPTWANVLSAGAASGAVSPIVTAGQGIVFGADPGGTSQIRSTTTIDTQCSSNLTATISGFMSYAASNFTFTTSLSNKNVIFQGGGIQLSRSAAIAVAPASATGVIWAKTQDQIERLIWTDITTSGGTSVDWPLDAIGVKNQLTATTVSASTATLALVPSMTIPAGTLIAGSSFEIVADVRFTRGATATACGLVGTLTLGGGPVVATWAAPLFTSSGGGTCTFTARFTILTTGGAGTALCTVVGNGDCGVTPTSFCFASSGFAAANAINTTIANTLAFTCNMSALVAGTSIQALGGRITRVA